MDVAISEKIHNINVDDGIYEVSKLLKNLSSGIRVSLERLDIIDRGWIKVNFSGEDTEILLELLRINFGLLPLSSEKIKIGDIFKGFISEINSQFIHIDMGVLFPKFKDGLCSLSTLQAQLLDGARVPMKKFVRRFFLNKDMPIEIRVEKNEGNEISVELSEYQKDFFINLSRIPLEKVIVIGAFLGEIHDAINSSRINRDIIRMYSLSLTTHILICKLGTDSLGVIVKIGSFLNKAKIIPFVYTK